VTILRPVPKSNPLRECQYDETRRMLLPALRPPSLSLTYAQGIILSFILLSSTTAASAIERHSTHWPGNDTAPFSPSGIGASTLPLTTPGASPAHQDYPPVVIIGYHGPNCSVEAVSIDGQTPHSAIISLSAGNYYGSSGTFFPSSCDYRVRGSSCENDLLSFPGWSHRMFHGRLGCSLVPAVAG
jgi:hypothetical protein